MANKRKRTPHEKQIRFLTFLFGSGLVLLVVALLWLVNRPPGAGH